MEKINEYVQHVDTFMAKYPTMTQYDKLKELETKTGYPKAYFFLVAALLVTGLVSFAGGMKLVSDLIGFLYPAYMSFRAMDSVASTKNTTGSNVDATNWLVYWVIFSLFAVVEGAATFLIDWIPMYYAIKAGAVVWLFHPKTMGSSVLYSQVIRPHVLTLLNSTNAGGATAKPAKAE